MRKFIVIQCFKVFTTNGLDCVAKSTVFTAKSLTKSALSSSHAAVKNGTFGTINGSNWCPTDISGRKSNERYSYFNVQINTYELWTNKQKKQLENKSQWMNQVPGMKWYCCHCKQRSLFVLSLYKHMDQYLWLLACRLDLLKISLCLYSWKYVLWAVDWAAAWWNIHKLLNFLLRLKTATTQKSKEKWYGQCFFSW